MHPANFPRWFRLSKLDRLFYELAGGSSGRLPTSLASGFPARWYPVLEWALGPKLTAEVRKADEARLAAAAGQGRAEAQAWGGKGGRRGGQPAQVGCLDREAWQVEAQGRRAGGATGKKVAAASTEAPLVPDLAEETSAPIPAKA